jgi:hypothetical protein
MQPLNYHGTQFTEQSALQLELARPAFRKIRRAVFAAMFEGVTVVVFGILTVLFGIGSIGQVLLGLVLLAIGAIEIWGAGRLRRLNPQGARILMFNQLAFAGLILLYAIWNLGVEAAHPTPDLADLSPSDAAALNQSGMLPNGVTHMVMLLMYGSLIAVALIEAGMAMYYRSRGAYLREYLAQTPDWIVSMQKTGVSI